MMNMKDKEIYKYIISDSDNQRIYDATFGKEIGRMSNSKLLFEWSIRSKRNKFYNAVVKKEMRKRGLTVKEDFEERIS